MGNAIFVGIAVSLERKSDSYNKKQKNTEHYQLFRGSKWKSEINGFVISKSRFSKQPLLLIFKSFKFLLPSQPLRRLARSFEHFYSSHMSGKKGTFMRLIVSDFVESLLMLQVQPIKWCNFFLHFSNINQND